MEHLSGPLTSLTHQFLLRSVLLATVLTCGSLPKVQLTKETRFGRARSGMSVQRDEIQGTTAVFEVDNGHNGEFGASTLPAADKGKNAYAFLFGGFRLGSQYQLAAWKSRKPLASLFFLLCRSTPIPRHACPPAAALRRHSRHRALPRLRVPGADGRRGSVVERNVRRRPPSVKRAARGPTFAPAFARGFLRIRRWNGAAHPAISLRDRKEKPGAA